MTGRPVGSGRAVPRRLNRSIRGLCRSPVPALGSMMSSPGQICAGAGSCPRARADDVPVVMEVHSSVVTSAQSRYAMLDDPGDRPRSLTERRIHFRTMMSLWLPTASVGWYFWCPC